VGEKKWERRSGRVHQEYFAECQLLEETIYTMEFK